jgi:hypothetical protein
MRGAALAALALAALAGGAPSARAASGPAVPILMYHHIRRAGYLAATTTRTGYATAGGPFRLARVQVSRGMSATDLLRRLRTLRGRVG